MVDLEPKVSIIGCGNVGVRYAYALMISGIVRQIVMVDIDKKRMEGEVMDLSHGAPYISPVEITPGNYSDISNSDLVVITAGRKQKPNQTRIDLAKENIDLYKNIIPKLMKYSPKAIFLVVSNPVDILTYAAYKFSGKPSTEVIGSGTALDTARFRFLLGAHCKVDPRNVHAYILGEHGDSEFAVWSTAMIGGQPLQTHCGICDNSSCDHEAELEKIFLEVRDSAYKIIERKGETSYGIGLTLVRITKAIINDENSILPVSSLINDYLELDDVCISLPCMLNKNGIRQVLKIELDSREQKEFKKSALILKKVLKSSGLQ